MSDSYEKNVNDYNQKVKSSTNEETVRTRPPMVFPGLSGQGIREQSRSIVFATLKITIPVILVGYTFACFGFKIPGYTVMGLAALFLGYILITVGPDMFFRP